MNDSCHQSQLASLSKLIIAVGAITYFGSVSGCASPGSFRSARSHPAQNQSAQNQSAQNQFAQSQSTKAAPARSAQAADSDTQTLLAESQAIQTNAVEEPTSIDAPNSTNAKTSFVPQVTLVSAALTNTSHRPTLITLASNADLNQTIANAPGPVLLDFYADWCGPCRIQGQILHEMEAAAARTQTTIVKINVDEHRDLAQQLDVSSLPTLMMVKNGRVTERQTGVATKQRLADWMK